VYVLVSACLLGVNCRYDGGNCLNVETIRRAGSRWIVPVCPEQLGGLPTPRAPADIVAGEGGDVLDGRSRVLTDDGTDITPQFIRGAHEVLRIARLLGADKAILKQRSPSCGCGQICRDGRIFTGDGVTAALLRREGIQVFSL
jgi:uncharacterized protein YbbK (DUF523 family)